MSRVQVRLNEISAGKISCLEVHPKRPWVASALDNGMIRIFDYVSNQLVHQFSLLDLETAEKNAQMLHAMVEKDPSYKGPRKPEVKLNKKAIGTIKVIKFIDQDIRFIKFRNEVRNDLTQVQGRLLACTLRPCVGDRTYTDHMNRYLDLERKS